MMKLLKRETLNMYILVIQCEIIDFLGYFKVVKFVLVIINRILNIIVLNMWHT